MLLGYNYMYLKKLNANLLRFYIWMKFTTSIFKVGGKQKSLAGGNKLALYFQFLILPVSTQKDQFAF